MRRFLISGDVDDRKDVEFGDGELGCRSVLNKIRELRIRRSGLSKLTFSINAAHSDAQPENGPRRIIDQKYPGLIGRRQVAAHHDLTAVEAQGAVVVPDLGTNLVREEAGVSRFCPRILLAS